MQEYQKSKHTQNEGRVLAGYMIYRNNHPFDNETLYDTEDSAKLAVQYSAGHAVIWMKLRQPTGSQTYLYGGHPESISSEMVDDECLENTRAWLSSLTPEDAARIPSEESRYVIAPLWKQP